MSAVTDWSTRWVPNPRASVMVEAPGFPVLSITNGATEAAIFNSQLRVSGQPRLRFRAATGATNDAISINHTTEYLSAWHPGANAPGFVWNCRFGLRDDIPANVADTKFFVGIGAGTGAMGNANLTALTNHVGMCLRQGALQLEMVCAGASSRTFTPIPFSEFFVADGTEQYDLTIISQPFGSGSATIWWRVVTSTNNGASTASAGRFVGGSATLPLGVPLNDFKAFRANVGAATNRVGINLHSVDIRVYGPSFF